MIYIILLFSLLSFITTLLIIPTILKIGNKYKLYDNNLKFKLNSERPIILGGISIVVGFVLPFKFLSKFYLTIPPEFTSLNSVLLFVFIIGIADDLLIFTPFKKLVCQLMIAFVIVFINKLQIPTHIYDNVFITDSNFANIASILFILVTMNAFNLIDGVDGLSASISLISLFTFGILLFSTNNYFFTCISFSICGAIIAFLKYNKSPAVMYMGDAGALFIGLIISIFTLTYIKDSYLQNNKITLNELSCCFSVVMYPVLDLTRLFVIRIRRNKNPFKGDKKHLHHLLLELGCTPNQITIWLSLFQIAMISISFIAFNSFMIYCITSFIFFISTVHIVLKLISVKTKMNKEYNSASSIEFNNWYEYNIIYRLFKN